MLGVASSVSSTASAILDQTLPFLIPATKKHFLVHPLHQCALPLGVLSCQQQLTGKPRFTIMPFTIPIRRSPPNSIFFTLYFALAAAMGRPQTAPSDATVPLQVAASVPAVQETRKAGF